MYLYSTTFVIHDSPVKYRVSKEQELLLFKPEPPYERLIETPIFWAAAENGIWNPINVDDASLALQAIEDLRKHF